MTTTAANQVDFTYRWNRVFFDKNDFGSANALFNAAGEAIDGKPVSVELNELGVGDWFRAFGRDGTRTVVLGRSLNAKWYVSMNNIDAPVKEER